METKTIYPTIEELTERSKIVKGIALKNGAVLEVGGKVRLNNWKNGDYVKILALGKVCFFAERIDGFESHFGIKCDWIPYTEAKEEPKPLETWTKTMDLRYRVATYGNNVIQQKHISNIGNERWVDIETVVI